MVSVGVRVEQLHLGRRRDGPGPVSPLWAVSVNKDGKIPTVCHSGGEKVDVCGSAVRCSVLCLRHCMSEGHVLCDAVARAGGPSAVLLPMPPQMAGRRPTLASGIDRGVLGDRGGGWEAVTLAAGLEGRVGGGGGGADWRPPATLHHR